MGTLPPLDETRGPMLYGGEPEGRRRTSTVRSYIHRRHPHHALLLVSFFLFCDLQNIHSSPLPSARAYINEDVRALLTLTIGDVNLFKTCGRTPSSKVGGGLVLIDKGLTVSPFLEPLLIVLAGTGLSPVSLLVYILRPQHLNLLLNLRQPHSWALTGAFLETHWSQRD